MADAMQARDSSSFAKPITALKSVDDLVKKVEALRRYRQPLEKQWRLNLAFLKGRQYSFYPPKSNTLQTLSVEDGTKPRHRVRMVDNQIMPGVHTYLAQLTKTKPHLYATPGSGSAKEIKAAQMAESLLEMWWGDLALDEKLDEALLWSTVGSAGYWKISWDPFANKQMRFLLGPDGNPITDEALRLEFTSQLEQMGIPPQEKVVYMGDIKVDVMSPFDVFLDPTAKTFEDCQYVICCHAMTPEEVKTRFNVDVNPDSSPASPDSTLPFANSGNAPELSVRKVYLAYFKPSASLTNGRYVAFTEGGDKQILHDEKWPYPFNQLPLIKFAGMRVPGSVYDDAVVTHAIPLQKELNRTRSQIVEYKNLTINPVMISPVGSLRTRRTTEPGQVLEYTPVGNGLKPEFEQLPTLPPYVFEHLRDIEGALQNIFLSAEVLQGKVPPNVEAGIAIDLLQEMATDKLAPIIKLMENSLARGGQQLLSLAQKYYIEPRLLQIRGTGGSLQVKQFQQADIAGNVTIHAEAGSGLPRTRAGRQARIERMVEIGVLPANKAAQYMDVADMRGLEKNWQADEDMAYRNNDKLIKKAPLNPEAVQHAMQAVNQGINPDTQQPIQSPEEAQAILHNASLQPQPGIDYDTHLDITSLFMKSVEFDGLPTEIRQDFITYWSNLLNAKFSMMPMPEALAPRVTYQIKGTAGPTASSKMLERAGVQVTPDEMSEPPLETWISDSIDKPDTDASGPGQEANQLSEAAKTVLAAQAADAASKQDALNKSQAHEAALHTTAQAAAHDQRAQARAEEIHQQTLAHNEAKHQAELKATAAKAKAASRPRPASRGK